MQEMAPCVAAYVLAHTTLNMGSFDVPFKCDVEISSSKRAVCLHLQVSCALWVYNCTGMPIALQQSDLDDSGQAETDEVSP